METETYKGYTIEILNDENAESPREWDNMFTIVGWHGRYRIGDENGNKYGDGNDFLAYLANIEIDEIDVDKLLSKSSKHSSLTSYLLSKVQEKYVIQPVFMYEHSGITISTSNGSYPFNCRWDSGQVGWIYCSKERIREEYCVKKLTKKILERAENHLQAEIDVYDEYLRGNVYGYRIAELGDSCFGYFGYDHEKSGLMDEARSVIDWHIKEEKKKHFASLKAWIKSKVNLQYRKPYDYKLATA